MKKNRVTIKTKDGRLTHYDHFDRKEVTEFLTSKGMVEDNELKTNLSFKFV